MVVIYQIFAFLIVFGIIVLVHEFGHFFAARLMGVRVETFSFGFGKKLFGRKLGETDFRVSLVPLGGYVKMAGEEDFDPKNSRPDDFYAKNRAQRIFILLMGPVMNMVLAFFILSVIFMSGVEVETYKNEKPVIGYVQNDSPAAGAGLRRGDEIISIAGKKIPDWKNLEMAIGANPDQELDIVYRRNNRQYETRLKSDSVTEYNLGYAGIYFGYATKIETVEKDSPAEKSGLLPGDIIESIDRKQITFFEVSQMISGKAGQKTRLEIVRKNRKLNVEVVPEEKEGKARIGIAMVPFSPTEKRGFGFFQSLNRSASEMVRLTSLTFSAFKKMVVGKLSPKNLSGPIEIAKFSQRALASGATNFFMLIAFISLQLGIVNLFPIPALDGGHLMIFTLEAIFRRDFSTRLKEILITGGFVLLIGLMIFVILNDLAKVLPRGWGSFLPF